MDKIVHHGLKLDLHIHSCVSSPKDGSKVKNNTIDNIPLLISKLNVQGVNLCAITDHDAFSYEMYTALKKAETQDNSVQKVFPGVEFSVSILDSESKAKTIHVVAIFSDKDEEKIAAIETVLNKYSPDKDNAFNEETFLRILREIDLDTILIAHQKNSLTSKTTRKNDAITLGEDKFLELIAADYFEAFEFKNKRNEVVNKNYLVSKGIDEDVRFITGTDCHDWSVYPKEVPSDTMDEFPYTYAKCLPTFRGLVMALTDTKRLKQVDSFFNVDKTVLNSIEIKNDGETVSIPLSRGINVIIGDNSVGKSMLLHALTGFKKKGEQLPPSIKNGYKSYITKKKLEIKEQLKSDKVFVFDMQGEVRKKFEENRLVATEFSNYFPPNVNPQPYRTIIYNEIDRLVAILEDKFKFDSEEKKLGSFAIFVNENAPESLSFVGRLRDLKSKFADIDTVITAFAQLQVDYLDILDKQLDDEDKETLEHQLKVVEQLSEKYKRRRFSIEEENRRIEAVAKVLNDVKKKHDRSASDFQKKRTSFLDNTATMKAAFKELIIHSRSIEHYHPSVDKTAIEIACNPIQDYQFVSKLNLNEISPEVFMQHVKGLFKARRRINFDTITEKQLQESLLNYDNSPVLQFFKAALIKSFDDDFKPKQSINLKGADKTEELSSGLNAKIYFDLLSYENSKDGVYVIDQPEDNVSQPSIKEYLLDCFKTMGENRQVIMVSHNPQFIVNLDVDNIVFVSSSDDGKLRFQSGALEYECNDYSVLTLVENNIDGGLESIKKRWKWYEKNNRI